MLTWAWLIVIGGLMFTPGGIECVVCGPVLTKIMGAISIALGLFGLVSRAMSDRAPEYQQHS